MAAAPLTSPTEILDAMLSMVRQSVLSGLSAKSIHINRAAMQALGPKELATFKVCYPNVEIKVVSNSQEATPEETKESHSDQR